MKTTSSICLLLFLIAPLGAASAEPFRTDINPALLYYQAYLSAPQMSEAELDYLGTNTWTGLSQPPK